MTNTNNKTQMNSRTIAVLLYIVNFIYITCWSMTLLLLLFLILKFTSDSPQKFVINDWWYFVVVGFLILPLHYVRKYLKHQLR